MAGVVGKEENPVSWASTGEGAKENSVVKQFTDLVSEEVRLQLRHLFDQQKGLAVGKLDALSGVFHQAADQLSQESHNSFARYATSAADRMDVISHRLRDKGFDQFAEDSKRFLKSKSAVVLGGGLVVGYLMGMALKRAYQPNRINRTRYQEVPPLH